MLAGLHKFQICCRRSFCIGCSEIESSPRPKLCLRNSASEGWEAHPILFAYTKQLCHFPILEAFSGNVWLHPCAIDHKLWNGPLAGALDYFLGGSRRLLNVDFVKGNVVLGEPAFCDMAIPAPRGGIDG